MLSVLCNEDSISHSRQYPLPYKQKGSYKYPIESNKHKLRGDMVRLLAEFQGGETTSGEGKVLFERQKLCWS